jgi:hypothetical protein
VELTAAACPWIGPEDAAVLHLSGLLAGLIDDSEDQFLTDKLAGRLMQTLTALGVTPEQRMKLDQSRPAAGKLSLMRADAERAGGVG